MFPKKHRHIFSPFFFPFSPPLQIGVFGVTASFSLFAYIWLLIILKWSSEGVVTMVEAVLTFAFFPVLVLVAYAADKRWFHHLLCRSGQSGSQAGAGGPGGAGGGGPEEEKRRQIELGNFTPGESTCRFNFSLSPPLPLPPPFFALLRARSRCLVGQSLTSIEPFDP